MILIIFFSCKNKRVERVRLKSKKVDSVELHNAIKFNSINIFDNFGVLTKNPDGIFFEIELKNFDFKTHDTLKYHDHYISKFELVTKEKKYQLFELSKSNFNDNKIKSFVLRLQLIDEDDYLPLDLENLKKYLETEILRNDAHLILKTDKETFSVKVDSAIINYYYNAKKIEPENIKKYFKLSHIQSSPAPDSIILKMMYDYRKSK